MPYTDEEISNAVDKATLTSIRRNTGSLGEPQIAQTFNDVQEAALGVFLLYQTSPFYVIYLGTQRLLEALHTHTALLLSLEQALLACGRRVLPVDNVTPLANAAAALFELQSAATSRTSSFASIESTPAFQRFSSNVDVFLDQNGSALKFNGDIAQTPQEAKATIQTLLPQVLTSQADIEQQVTYLQNALVNYSSLNLPAVASQGIVARVSQTVAKLSSSMRSRTPTDRLMTLRSGVLDLLTSRAVLRQVGSFKTPSPIFPLEGTATAFADATHPAVPAESAADIYAPYEIQGSPTLSIALDGGPAQSMVLPNSLLASFFGTSFEPFTFTGLSGASITGTVAETFNISSGVNDLLVVYVYDVVANVTTQVFCPLTSGPARTAAQVAVDISAAFTGVALGTQYEAVAGGPSNQRVVIRSKAGVQGSLVRIAVGQGTAGATLGISPGVSSTGTDSNTDFIVTVDGVPHPMSFVAGSTSAASAASQINTALAAAGIQASASGPLSLQSVTVSYTGINPFTTELLLPAVGNPAAAVLGLITGAPTKGRATNAREVALAVRQALPDVATGTSVTPAAGGAGLLLRSEPSDPSLVVAYKARGDGVVASLGGNALSLAGDFADLGIVPGDVLVFRDGVNLNTKWNVVTVTPSLLTAVGVAPAVPGAATYEIGPLLAVIPGDVVEVPSGVQNGVYTIAAVGPGTLAVPFEFELQTTLPGFQSALFGPAFFRGNVGQERVHFGSQSTGANSAVTVSGLGAATFFGSGSASAVGTTTWVRLSEKVPALGPGDILEDYQTSYNAPSSSNTIVSVEELELGLMLPVPLTKVFNITSSSTVPFALLRSTAFTKFQTMSMDLASWLLLPVNGDAFTRELRRLVNIVLYESAPAPDQINAAMAQVELLMQAALTGGAGSLAEILSQFTVSPIDQVDALIRTYVELGSARAIDILLQGRFSDFFGLSIKEVSYASTVLSRVQSIAQEDLVVRKTNRTVSRTSAVRSSASSPDFEYDTSDIEQTSPIDVPNEFDRVPPGSDPSNS